ERLPGAPRLVLPPRLEAVEQLHLDAGLPQALEAATVHERVRVARADDDARHAGRDDGVGARRRAAVMGAGLEGHVERRPARPLARLLERDRLRVTDGVVLVPALADDLPVADDHGADERMVADLAAAAFRELERALERAHRSARTSLRQARGRSSRWKMAAPATP